MKRVVQKGNCTLLRGTLPTRGGEFSACLRPHRRLRGGGALQVELCRLQAKAARSGTPGPGRGGTGAFNGVCGWIPRRSCRWWKQGVGRQVSERSVALRQCQQAGALQTLREFGGAVRGRGSAWSAAACRRCVSSPSGAQPSHEMLSPRVEAGTLGGRATRGPLRARKRWLSRRSLGGSTRSGGTMGVNNGGRKGWGVGRWMRVAERIRVRSSGPASFGLRP